MPFLVRAGKHLPVTAVEIIVDLHFPPQTVFHADNQRRSNYIRFRLSPDVTIALGARAKAPGEAMAGDQTELIVAHQPGDEMSAYERLIGDAMMGDTTLFARKDSAEAQWRIVEPILGDNSPVHEYEPGTWGPDEAAAVARPAGGWYDPGSTAAGRQRRAPDAGQEEEPGPRRGLDPVEPPDREIEQARKGDPGKVRDHQQRRDAVHRSESDDRGRDGQPQRDDDGEAEIGSMEPEEDRRPEPR